MGLSKWFYTTETPEEENPVVGKDDLRTGQIIKMSPGYHTKNPYYVEIIYISPYRNEIITHIPGEHQLTISENSNWDYHLPRMTIVGTQETHGHLLLNQPLD